MATAMAWSAQPSRQVACGCRKTHPAHATWVYSWIAPPRRSSRRIRWLVGWWSGLGEGAQRWRLAEGAVRPVFVVVHHVTRQRHLDMSSTHDQHPVQQLTTDRADPSLGDGVYTWRPHRRPQHLDPPGGQGRVERGGELPIPVTK